jgi:hypothetical protein
VCVCVCVCVRVCACVCVSVLYVCVCVCGNVCTSTHVRTYAHTHTQTHTHTNTHTKVSSASACWIRTARTRFGSGSSTVGTRKKGGCARALSLLFLSFCLSFCLSLTTSLPPTPLPPGCDSFHHLAAMSHEQAAQTINDQGVHVLIDLMGHTRFNRLQANQQDSQDSEKYSLPSILESTLCTAVIRYLQQGAHF